MEYSVVLECFMEYSVVLECFMEYSVVLECFMEYSVVLECFMEYSVVLEQDIMWPNVQTYEAGEIEQVWYMIWYDMIRYNTIFDMIYDMIHDIIYHTIPYDTIRYDTIRYDTIRYHWHLFAFPMHRLIGAFWCWAQNSQGELGQYHRCWCPGSLHHWCRNHCAEYIKPLFCMINDFNNMHNHSVKKWNIFLHFLKTIQHVTR